MKHTKVYACFFFIGKEISFITRIKKLRSVQYEKKRIERASKSEQYAPPTATRNLHTTQPLEVILFLKAKTNSS